MDNINFRGGFLIKNPSARMWNNIQAVIPRRKCVFHQYNEEGDKFFAIKDFYDKYVADFILSKRIKFKYYPSINLKSRLDTYYPEESKQIIESQDDVITTKRELRKYIKAKRKQTPPIDSQYHWQENDHIPQTMKALGLNPREHRAEVKDGITTIYNMKGEKIAAASPNGTKGINFVYVYPSKDNKDKINSRRLAVDKDGKIICEYSIADFTDFQKFFLQNIKIDKGRIRPTGSLK